jgi:hypothetical protein
VLLAEHVDALQRVAVPACQIASEVRDAGYCFFGTTTGPGSGGASRHRRLDAFDAGRVSAAGSV